MYFVREAPLGQVPSTLQVLPPQLADRDHRFYFDGVRRESNIEGRILLVDINDDPPCSRHDLKTNFNYDSL
jgi:hypothetical protein